MPEILISFAPGLRGTVTPTLDACGGKVLDIHVDLAPEVAQDEACSWRDVEFHEADAWEADPIARRAIGGVSDGDRCPRCHCEVGAGHVNDPLLDALRLQNRKVFNDSGNEGEDHA